MELYNSGGNWRCLDFGKIGLAGLKGAAIGAATGGAFSLVGKFIRYVKTPAFWQYYPKGNPGYQSPWLAKGTRFKPPYKVGDGAQKALNLPPHNPGTAVRPIKISLEEVISGPRTPKPQPWRNVPGEGEEYFRGPNFPN